MNHARIFVWWLFVVFLFLLVWLICLACTAAVGLWKGEISWSLMRCIHSLFPKWRHIDWNYLDKKERPSPSEYSKFEMLKSKV